MILNCIHVVHYTKITETMFMISSIKIILVKSSYMK